MVTKIKKGFRLTQGDIEILEFIYLFRLVTIEHLIILTERSRRTLNRRLVRLAENRYVYRRRSFPFEKFIYTINRAAAPILVERGVASKEVLDLRVRLHELTDLFLKHALMMTDIHVALELAGRSSPSKLISWREGKELYDRVLVREDGREQRLSVRPDAFFTLQDTRRPEGQNKSHFFLEADRSTTTHKRFQRKIQGYSGYFEQGLHTKKYGIRNARVLTITLTKSRALGLCEAASEVLEKKNSKFYYFAPVEHFSLSEPEEVFGDIFFSPRDYHEGKRYQLVLPLAK